MMTYGSPMHRSEHLVHPELDWDIRAFMLDKQRELGSEQLVPPPPPPGGPPVADTQVPAGEQGSQSAEQREQPAHDDPPANVPIEIDLAQVCVPTTAPSAPSSAHLCPDVSTAVPGSQQTSCIPALICAEW